MIWSQRPSYKSSHCDSKFTSCTNHVTPKNTIWTEMSTGKFKTDHLILEGNMENKTLGHNIRIIFSLCLYKQFHLLVIAGTQEMCGHCTVGRRLSYCWAIRVLKIQLHDGDSLWGNMGCRSLTISMMLTVITASADSLQPPGHARHH